MGRRYDERQARANIDSARLGIDSGHRYVTPIVTAIVTPIVTPIVTAIVTATIA